MNYDEHHERRDADRSATRFIPATGSWRKMQTSPRSANPAISPSSVRRRQRSARWGTSRSRKQTMKEAGVPVIPGSDGLVEDMEEAVRVAREIGYPVHHQGDGRRRRQGNPHRRGRGSPRSVRSPLHSRKRRRPSAMPACIWRNISTGMRHVEMQIIADKHGNVVPSWRARLFHPAAQTEADRGSAVSGHHAGDPRAAWGKRRCVPQRPWNIPAPERSNFCLIRTGNFYFMEMNTRIQVEHPVTEMITNVDIIKEMIPDGRGTAVVVRARKTSSSTAGRSNAASMRRDPNAELHAFAGQDRVLLAAWRYRRSRGQRGLSGVYDFPALRFDDRRS